MYPRNRGQVQGQISRSNTKVKFHLNLTLTFDLRFDLELDRYFVGTLRLKLYTTLHRDNENGDIKMSVARLRTGHHLQLLVLWSYAMAIQSVVDQNCR